MLRWMRHSGWSSGSYMTSVRRGGPAPPSAWPSRPGRLLCRSPLGRPHAPYPRCRPGRHSIDTSLVRRKTCMATKRTIHVVGTGTIGEPLLGLLLHTQRALEVDEITFHKHTPRLGDRAKITNLVRRGARLAVDTEKLTDFEKLGLQPAYTTEEALAQATVVIDCTSDGLGLAHKRDWYEHLPRAQGFIAQGSETGFGKMYARGINDEALVPDEDRFVQVVSCNTHNLAVLIATLALHDEAPDNLVEGRFVCMRRSSDISQEKSFIAAPEAGAHK